jgi:hypothetical protein
MNDDDEPHSGMAKAAESGAERFVAAGLDEAQAGLPKGWGSRRLGQLLAWAGERLE